MNANFIFFLFLLQVIPCFICSLDSSNGPEKNVHVISSLVNSSSLAFPSFQLQSLALDELGLLPQKQDQEKQQQSTEKDVQASQFNFLHIPTEASSVVKRKMSILSEVYDAVTELFEKVIGRRRDGLVGEAFGQLRMRCIEKIFNLKFLLQVVDRLVSERTHLERMSTLFQSLARKRTNETEFLVNQVHRTAAELSESIRGDLARVVDHVDGGILSNIFSSPLSSSSGLLSSSPLLSILGKMDGLKKFTIKRTSRGHLTLDD